MIENIQKIQLTDIKLIVYDFDGIMTDNKVYVDQDGREMVQVNRADGLAVSAIKKLDIQQIIISTEKNPVVSARASKLGIPCRQGIDDKKIALLDYCKKNDFELNHVAFVGNDINDRDVMEMVGYTICPADAHSEINKISNLVMKTKGGHGVIRELLDFIIK